VGTTASLKLPFWDSEYWEVSDWAEAACLGMAAACVFWLSAWCQVARWDLDVSTGSWLLNAQEMGERCNPRPSVK